MATIEDVARMTGLSRATVSRVMNGHPYVTEEKRALVQKAMNELSYVPNSMARRLRTQKTETIAVLVPRIANPFFSQLVASMESVANESDFQLVVCQTNQLKERESKYLELLKTKQVDGIILTSIENEWQDVEPFTEYGPIILCNEYVDDARVPEIRLNQFHGSYIGTRHLIEKGYKKIARCTGFQSTGLSRDRNLGFLKALEEDGLSFRKDWLFTNAFNVNDGKRILRQILSLNERPDAIFTGSDEVAAGIIKEAKTAGLKIPDDLAVLGFDNQPIAELMDPGITTIHQPTEKMGIAAMRTIINCLEENKPLEKLVIECPIELVIREST
jgi:DNA-binding LacI/PurR family transcriptional regulator